MVEVFDATRQPLSEIWYGALALLPIAWFVWLRLSGKPASIWVPIVAATLGAMLSGILLWDQLRVKEMIRSGEGMQVTRGLITNAWRIQTRKRDWSQKESLRYKTINSEGFDVGDQRFSWNVGDSLSPVTFTNNGKTPVRFTIGDRVEVHWFTDPASDNQRRIVRLLLGQSNVPASSNEPTTSPITKPSKTPPTGSFDTFWSSFTIVVAQGDAAGVRALTQMPFLFGGNMVEADQFDDLWAGLFMPAIRNCLAIAQPQPEQDGSLSTICAGTIFVFRKNATGQWRFAEIGVDD